MTRLPADLIERVDTVIWATYQRLIEEQRARFAKDAEEEGEEEGEEEEKEPPEAGVTTDELVRATRDAATTACAGEFALLVGKLVASRVPIVMEAKKPTGYMVSEPLIPGLERLPTIFSVPQPAGSGMPKWVPLDFLRVGQLSRSRQAVDKDIEGRIAAAASVRRADDICKALSADEQEVVVEILRATPRGPRPSREDRTPL